MNIIRRHMLTATMALSMASLAFAQAGNRPDGGGSRLDFLAGYLNLTDAQRTQAQTIFTAANTAATTARGTLTAARDALSTAVKANRADTELDRLAAAVGAAQGQIEAINAKTNARFYALLTAEQKTRYDALAARRGGGPRDN